MARYLFDTGQPNNATRLGRNLVSRGSRIRSVSFQSDDVLLRLRALIAGGDGHVTKNSYFTCPNSTHGQAICG